VPELVAVAVAVAVATGEVCLLWTPVGSRIAGLVDRSCCRRRVDCWARDDGGVAIPTSARFASTHSPLAHDDSTQPRAATEHYQHVLDRVRGQGS
jgi:hypothetical protein